MKKLTLLLGIFIFVLTTLSALAIEGMPDWASTHKHSRYPSEMYLVGVGISSKSFDDAKDQARVDIAGQIRVHIRGEFSSFIKEEIFGGRTGDIHSYQKRIESSTESLVNEKLAGVQIVETSESDGNFYALAVLDKMKASEEMESAIKEGIKTVNRLLTHADELLKNGNISGAMADLSQAHSISSDIQIKNYLHQAISLMSLSEELSEELSDKTPPLILSQIRNILSRLRLVRVSGNGQMGKVGKQLPKPLVVQLNMRTQEEEMIPVEGMEVQFEFSPKEPIERQMTDSSGEASTMIAVSPPTGYEADMGKVAATLVLRRLPEELQGTLPVAYTVFHYGIERDTYPVRLSTLSEDGKNLPKLESKVKRTLNRLGYTVEKDARVSLEGTLAVNDVKEIGGLKPQTLVLVELELSILDAEEGAVLDSISLSGKGLGKSEKIAFQKAATTMKINERKLSSLLQVGKESFVKARERRSKERFEHGEQLFNAGKYKAALRKLEGVAVGTEFYDKAQKLVRQIRGANMPPVPRPSIAIFEPKSDGSRRQRESTKTLRDMMTTAFIRNRELKVIERERLKEIMSEVQLGLSGFVNQSQAAQIGRLAGADALLLSSMRLVGRNVELDVRLIKTETGESLAAATSKKPSDELRAIAEEIADKIISFLDETPLATIPVRSPRRVRVVKPTTAGETVEVPKIRVMVVMPEQHIRRLRPRRIPDPAGETEIIRKFLEKGFLVVDQAQVKKIRSTEKVRLALKDPKAAAALAREFDADVIIIGEAFSVFDKTKQPGGRLTACRARLEARAVRTDDAVILAADGKHAAGLDQVEELAAKSALKNAGGLIADYFIEQILKKWGKEQAEGGAMVQVLAYNIKEYGDLVKFEKMLKSMDFVQALHRRSFSETSARIDVEMKGNAQKLADSLYAVEQPLVKVKVRNFSTNKVEVEIGE